MVFRDGMRDALQHHRLARARGCHDKSALALAHRRDQIDHPRGIVLLVRIERQLERQLRLGIQWSEIVEMDPVTDRVRLLEIDRPDLEKREIAFTIFRRTNLSLNRITRAKTKAADLAR